MKIIKYLLFILIANPVFAQVKEYNIAVILNDECSLVAKKINKIAENKLNDVENLKNISHISLYQLAMSEDDINTIKNELDNLNFSPFEIRLKFSKKNKLIALDVLDSTNLNILHKKVIEIFSKYSKEPIKRMLSSYNNLTSQKQKQIDIYGTTNILEFYKPKMSLFYNYSNNDLRFDNLMEEIELKFPNEIFCRAEKLVIGELGEQGNLLKIIFAI